MKNYPLDLHINNIIATLKSTKNSKSSTKIIILF